MAQKTYPKNISTELQRLIDQGNAIIEELSEGKESAASALKGKWSELSDAVRNTFEKYSDVAADKSAQIAEQSKQALDQGRKYVRDNPARAAGLAVLTGIVVGFLLGRRK